ncbi:MAG: hypothetical protein JXN61_02960 [Sedimentisphaerales bacterium]|nr:hypothetical protein [Sedimentisphaerales bacterium]
MDGAAEKHNGNWPEAAKTTVDGARAHPTYDFYEQGVKRVTWLTAVFAAIQKGNGGHAVAIVAILTLCKIACDLVKNKADGVDLLTLIGCLVIAAMISTIGLFATFWAGKGYHAENTEEDESDTTELGAGREGSSQNGAAP